MMDFELRASDFELIGRQEGFENLSVEIDGLLETDATSTDGCSSPSRSSDNSSQASSDDEADEEWGEAVDIPVRERKLSFQLFPFPSEAETLEADCAREISELNSNVNFALEDPLSEIYGDRLSMYPHGQTAHMNRKALKRARDPVTGALLAHRMSVRVIFGENQVGDGQGAIVGGAQIVGAVGEGPDGFFCDASERRIGIYSPQARKARLERFHSKRKRRVWKKRIKYDCRKKLADSRPRIKGRFVKRKTKKGKLVLEGDPSESDGEDGENTVDMEGEIVEVGDSSDLGMGIN